MPIFTIDYKLQQIMKKPKTSPDPSEIGVLAGERLDEVNEDITLIQKKDGLTFGTDAYLLAAFIRPMRRAKAVELGAGTGIISLLIAARNKIKETVAVELQPEYAELCRRNTDLNGFSDRIQVLCADVRDLTPITVGYEADLVYSNPPYMRTDSGLPNENRGKNIARHETAGGIAEFCLAAAKLLKHGGIFACVYRPDRLPEFMSGLDRAGLEPKRMTFVCADAKTAPSMVLIESRKGGGKGLNVTAPLILNQERHGSAPAEMTDEARAVYDTCALYPVQGTGRKNAERDKTKEHTHDE